MKQRLRLEEWCALGAILALLALCLVTGSIRPRSYFLARGAGLFACVALGYGVACVTEARATGRALSARWLALRLLAFLRDWAPFIVLIAMYENLLPLIGRLRPVLYDEQALSVDLALFGARHPGRWLASLATPGRTEWFAFFYLGLFALPVVSGGLAYLSGRRQAFRELLLTFTLAGFVGYVGYLLVPVIGPRYYFRSEYSVALTGSFAEVASRLSEMDALRSGQPRNCFPSLHTAWGLIVLFHAYRHFRWLFFAYLVPVASLVVATIYLRFHYAIDVVAGVLLASVATLFVPKLSARFDTDAPELPRLELPPSWIRSFDRVATLARAHWPYLALVVCVAPIYFSSLPTGISDRNRGEDGAELVAAAVTGGTAHPPGYALYVLVIRGACALFATRDPIDVAHAASAVFALLAGCAWVKIVRLALAERADMQPLFRDVSAFAAGAVLCFSPTLFGQAVIAEVYAFHAALLGLFLVFATRFLCARTEIRGREAFAFGCVGAAAIGHHLTAAPVVLATWLALVLAGVARKLGTRRLVAHGAGFLLGFLPLAYLPLRALADPALSWGRPASFARFVWVVSAAQYRHRFALTPEDWWPRLMAQLPLGSLPALALGLATVGGVAAALRPDSRRTLWLLVLCGGANFVSSLPYAIGDLSSYFLPLLGVVSALVGFGTYEALRALRNAPARLGAVSVWALPALLVVGALVGSMRQADAHGQSRLDKRVRELVAHAPPNSLIVARGDGLVFGLWYERFVRSRRTDVDIVSRELLGQSWYARPSSHFSARMHWPARLQGDVDRRLRDVIRANYGERPVVVVANVDLPVGCRRLRSGELSCEREVVGAR